VLFNSISFVIFFPIVLVLYLLLPKKARPFLLLAASYFFYMCWNPKYIVLIVLTTLTTYACALVIGKSEKTGTRKGALTGCILFNFAILFLFKYFDFFLFTVNKGILLFGAEALKSPFHFLLPVGISFYTFQTIGYVIDVYRGKIKAEKNIVDYALFVSFFPQLVAGPIEKSENLLPQIKSIKEKNLFRYEDLVSGFGCMLWGLFMKMVIADRAAILVNHVFDEYYKYGTVELVIAMVLFSIQIYADFAGYSYIAIGVARAMGIKLMENFNTPYFATGIKDFWDRWHISLSLWFRDYLYIPLGGNRKGKARKLLNLIIVFLASGLWHGASWHYVVWGGIHGLLRCLEELISPLWEKLEKVTKIRKEPFSYRFGKIVITFVCVNIAWVFFRAESLSHAVEYLKCMFTRFNPWVLFGEGMYELGLDRREFGILMFALLMLVVVSIIRKKCGKEIGVFLAEQNLWFRWAIFIILILLIIIYGVYGVNFSSAKFIYFDF